MTMTFDQIQALEPSAVIEMFVLDATVVGGSILYFHAGTNELSQNIVWQGVEYVRFPVVASGFSIDSAGVLARPRLQVSNYLSGVSALLMAYDDLVGSKVIRKRTLKKYLDAVNFSGGSNPSADPTSFFPDEVYFIDSKTTEKREFVEFELCSQLDLQGKQLPARQLIQNCCVWKYRGAECGYTGTTYFNNNDVPVTSPAQDVCGKRVSSCKLRFGSGNPIPFGGFPGVGLIQGG